MELTKEEIQIVVNLLNQISVPVNQANTVLSIISKLNLKLLPEGIKKEGDK